MSSLSVTLVIPARDAAQTIGPCLDALLPLQQNALLSEIIVVDDGSKDETASIIKSYPVRYLEGAGRGAGSARNLGWKQAQSDLVWFVDSDCVAEAGALERLLPYMQDEKVGAVGGSYGNMNTHSLVASLIHEEIVERHLRMPNRVSFLATFNILIRKKVLEQVGGFDERFLKAQDVELAYRIMEGGFTLAFDAESRVKHYHLTALLKYLKVQAKQGYWRIWLYKKHPKRAGGDSYAGKIDYAQPPLAMCCLATLPLVVLSWWPLIVSAMLLLLLQLPMALALISRTRKLRYLSYLPFGFILAFWRGVGMSLAVLSLLLPSKQSVSVG
ncbi:MAG: glycosyltransferase [Myxococcales bacterium]|nr:MAG: glycosyltransferase [Myxococcales bacterium]